jgi:CBS domain-containing protein
MQVREVMTRQVWTVREHESVELASAVLRFRRFRHLPVVDADGRVVGMITPTDLLRFASGSQARTVTVAQLATRPPVTIGEDDRLETAVERMREEGFHALPVVGASGRLVGIVTDVDVLTALARPRIDQRARTLAELTVDRVMTRDPVTIESDASLADAAEALLQGQFRHLPVLDHEGRLVGMLSERDLRSQLGADPGAFPSATLDALTRTVSEAMTPDPVSVQQGASLGDVLETFGRERVGALPVVDESERLVGIVSYVDLMLSLHRAARGALSASRGGEAGAPQPH